MVHKKERGRSVGYYAPARLSRDLVGDSCFLAPLSVSLTAAAATAAVRGLSCRKDRAVCDRPVSATSEPLFEPELLPDRPVPIRGPSAPPIPIKALLSRCRNPPTRNNRIGSA